MPSPPPEAKSPLEWSETRDAAPALLIRGGAGHEVRATFTARLAELGFSWSTSVSEVGPGDLLLPVDVPDEAWLHDEAAWYVTDLRAEVNVNGEGWLATTFLYWPGGRRSAPELLSEADLPVVAPQGMIGAEALATPGRHVRRMPDVSDVLALPAVIEEMAEVEP